MNNKIKIQHRPYGEYHPYEPSADQRVPHTPYAKQPVTLGILTEPIGAVETVLVRYWQSDNKADAITVAAQFLDQTSQELHVDDQGHLSEAAARAGLIFGVDNWQAALPAFPSGVQVHYQIIAQSQTSKIESDVYTYQVLQTTPITQIDVISHTADQIILNCSNQQDKLVHLKFGLTNPTVVNLEVGFGHLEIQQTQTPQNDSPSNFSIQNLAIHISQEPIQIQFGIKGHSAKTITAIEVVSGYNAGSQIKLTFDATENEGFYGFGERFDDLNQKGNLVDIRLFEQYKSQGKLRRTYLPMPLFISSQSYAYLLHSDRYAMFDLGHTHPNNWSIQIELKQLIPVTMNFIFNSSDKLIDLTQQLTDLTGKSPMLPEWAFGLWISANEWNTQKRVEEIVAQHKALDIPLSVVVIEAWSDEATFYIWNGAQYQPKPGDQKFSYQDFHFEPDGMWYDPKTMIENLHKDDIHLILWQIPAVKENQQGHPQLANDHQAMLENQYYVKKEDGTPYLIRPFWFKDGLLIDFTNPAAKDWWFSKREYLLNELGIDGFKTDGGEHLWDPTLRFYDGRRGDEMINTYAQLYVESYYQFAQSKGAITFSRSGYTGAQTAPCHWAGDENSTWEAFRHTVNAGLNAALSGVTYWGFDIGGFSGPQPSSELYLRATAFATFCPIMQYHAEYNHHQEPNNDRTPWQIDYVNQTDYVVPIFRKFAKLRYDLMPYILDIAKKSSETGIPMMRPYILDSEEQSKIMQTSYYFGDDLFVIPILDDAIRSIDIILPQGQWFDFWDNTQYQGGNKYTIETPLDRIPVFSRISKEQ